MDKIAENITELRSDLVYELSCKEAAHPVEIRDANQTDCSIKEMCHHE